ncbi:pectin lyase fold/virulence factor [Hyaloraphidium curvatum]|nr:pectin lyase fold/virulence factor [Hyaloraphidium curvatum]
MPGPQRSLLWGASGELWHPAGRVPDFSFAGYRCGELPIPQPPVIASVVDYGAKGDGLSDDTAAFNAGLAEAPEGAVLVPAGRYRITGVVTISRPRVVLRGEGPGRSVLVFDRPLTDVEPNWGATTTGLRTSNYSWSGGFLTIKGSSMGAQHVADVVGEARRGDLEIALSSVDGLSPGRWVEISIRDDDSRTLTSYLHGGDPGGFFKLPPPTTRQPARIASVDAHTKTIRLDRPLRNDLRPSWAPRLAALAPTVTDSGIESLRFEFPPAPWRGEFTELGHNAAAISGAAHCWIRDVAIHNADSGVYANGIHCTLDGIVLTADRPVETSNSYLAEGGCVGHHGLTANGSDNLVTRFDFRANYVHDLTVEGASAAGNVFSRGRGNDLCFDHHRKCNHANLFSDLDCGAGNRIWRCGGGADLGRFCGARGLFWNLCAGRPLCPPPAGWAGPELAMVGLRTELPSATPEVGWWLEAAGPEGVEPAEVHAAQVARRLGPPGGMPL